MGDLLQRPSEAGWLQEELDTLPWLPDPEQALSGFDPSRAPRLDAVVKEVMRLPPPVGEFFRFTTAPIRLTGIAIPENRVSIAATQRLRGPDDDLGVFRPRRHLGEGCGAMLLPVGGGEGCAWSKAWRNWRSDC